MSQEPRQEQIEQEQIMDIDRFQQTNADRGRRWYHGDLSQWSLLEWCGALCGEAGEAANVAKKLRRLDLALPNKEAGLTNADAEGLREKLANEIGDVMIYGLLILSDLGVSASDVIERVFDKKSTEYGFPERARPIAVLRAVPQEPSTKRTKEEVAKRIVDLVYAEGQSGPRILESRILEVIDDSDFAAVSQEPRQEQVICSAIRIRFRVDHRRADSIVVRGHRHADCFEAAARIPGITASMIRDAEQGFVTSMNRFVDRGTAWCLQRDAGFASAADGGYRGEILFSEDLY